MEEIANKIVQAIKNGMDKAVAERKLIPAYLSEDEIRNIKNLVDNKLMSHEHKQKRKTYSVNNYDDYGMEM